MRSTDNNRKSSTSDCYSFERFVVRSGLLLGGWMLQSAICSSDRRETAGVLLSKLLKKHDYV
tara:strand:- start:1134 stop:1319 length:186 start_codon:yes stop_codon:yes gene_type:complete